MNISFHEKELSINEKKITFPTSIQTVVQVKNGVIVLIKAFIKVSDRNVYFVNLDGAIKWRIQNLDPSKKISNQYYSYAGLNEDGVLEVNDINAYLCKVNLEDGALYDCEFTK
ncbi:MAG: hypothetical protein V4596_06740 [Bdellovibrionota bacterium]